MVAVRDEVGLVISELVARRKTLGLTQQDMAWSMGVAQATVAGFESGEIDVRMSSVLRYAKAVNLGLLMVPGESKVIGRPVP